jgi:hypothetical protein
MSSPTHHQFINSPKQHFLRGYYTLPYPNNTIKKNLGFQLLFHHPFIAIPPAGRVLHTCNYMHPHCRQTRSGNSDLEKDRRGAKGIPDHTYADTLSICSSFLSSTGRTKQNTGLGSSLGNAPDPSKWPVTGAPCLRY